MHTLSRVAVIRINELSFALGRPKEGSHCELSLLGDVSGDRKPILSEEAIEFPLGHGLIVRFAVPGIVKRHLEMTALIVHLVLVVPIRQSEGNVGAASSTHHGLSLFCTISRLKPKPGCPFIGSAGDDGIGGG